MATTGIVNGTLIKLRLTASTVAYLTSNDESLKNDLRETTNKDSGGNATYAYGKFGASYSFELLHVEGATNGYSTLFTALTGRTELSAEISSGVSGDKKYACTVLISDLKRTAPMEANTTVSGTLTVSGAIAESTI